MTVSIFDNTQCLLGEGPLWHPGREQFFWFDIKNKSLHSNVDGKTTTQSFDEFVSAAGWVDNDTLLMASETGLYRYDIGSGERFLLAPLEADNPTTRSNDGRADPFGGFWIGTMGKEAQDNAGAIYRYYRGEVRTLFPDISISNSICFSPDRQFAYFTDTRVGKIMRQALDPDHGWPKGDPTVLIDLTTQGLHPDGSVVDAQGCIWNAQWGAARVSKYSAEGQFLSQVDLPADQTTCPAFGGPDLTDLFVTSAAEGAEGADQGKTFLVSGAGKGQAEHQVIL
ncbi:MAG: SMP-30/gluconolactonase/LRE family protein [Marinosulfonomonas sp.]